MGLAIVDIWKDYFKDHHEGLGTTYERFILHRYFEKIKNHYSIRNILEVPSFGMTGVSGINSLWWSAHDTAVTIIDNDRDRLQHIEKVWKDIPLKSEFVYNKNFYSLPFDNDSFDLCWNFAALWFVPDLRRFLEELSRVTRKAIFICVPNKWGLGYITRFAIRKAQDINLNLDNIQPDIILKIMNQMEWHCIEKGYFDVPPWPDIAMKKEDLLSKFGLSWILNKRDSAPEERMCILDYFNGSKKNMESDIIKYALLENAPHLFKIFWAHHSYFIFAPSRDSGR